MRFNPGRMYGLWLRKTYCRHWSHAWYVNKYSFSRTYAFHLIIQPPSLKTRGDEIRYPKFFRALRSVLGIVPIFAGCFLLFAFSLSNPFPLILHKPNSPFTSFPLSRAFLHRFRGRQCYFYGHKSGNGDRSPRRWKRTLIARCLWQHRDL